MKKGKRYKTKEEIEKQIDKLRLRCKTYFAQAEEAEKSAISHFRFGRVSEGQEDLDIAFRIRRRAMNILDKKLPKLGEKLAEFLTYQLPGVDNGDQSIPAY